MKLRFLIFSAFMAALHLCAFAGSPSATVVPTCHCIGIYVPATSLSADPSTTVTVRYRAPGLADWRKGQPLVYDRRKNRFAGSIVNLEPGTSYTIEAERPGELSESLVFHTSTLHLPPPISEILKRKRFIHVSANGSDLNPGTTERPVLTIQHAVDLGTTGTAVVVHSGIYREQVRLRASRLSNPPIIILGAQGETAVVDGENLRDYAFDLNSVRDFIHGLTLRNTRRSIIRATNCRDLVITSNTLTDPGRHYFDSAIEICPGCADTVIQGNIIKFVNHPYTSGGMGISLRNTEGHHMIFENFIIGNGLVKDGIGGENNFGIKGGPYRDSDIYDNTISGCQDDAIESEGGGINVRIWGNHLSNSLVGLALAPVIVGPTYVWRNVVLNCGPAFKLGEGDHLGHGFLFLYHNTAWSNGTQNGGYAGSGGKGLFEHVTGRNNLISNNGLVFYDRRKSATNSFDYDLLHSTNPKRFLEWGAKGTRLSLAAARAMGFWVHAVAADPLLVAPPNDLSLSPESPAVDSGTILPNFNDNYTGKAPDIGAIEYGKKSITQNH